MFPFDGAAERTGLLDRGFPSRQNLVQGIREIMSLHVSHVAIIINPSLILESSLHIKGEDMGRADRTVLASYVLGLVPQVLKVEALVLRLPNRVLQTIPGIVVVAMALDG